jgi:hypothetical protein
VTTFSIELASNKCIKSHLKPNQIEATIHILPNLLVSTLGSILPQFLLNGIAFLPDVAIDGTEESDILEQNYHSLGLVSVQQRLGVKLTGRGISKIAGVAVNGLSPVIYIKGIGDIDPRTLAIKGGLPSREDTYLKLHHEHRERNFEPKGLATETECSKETLLSLASTIWHKEILESEGKLITLDILARYTSIPLGYHIFPELKNIVSDLATKHGIPEHLNDYLRLRGITLEQFLENIPDYGQVALYTVAENGVPSRLSEYIDKRLDKKEYTTKEQKDSILSFSAFLAFFHTLKAGFVHADCLLHAGNFEYVQTELVSWVKPVDFADMTFLGRYSRGECYVFVQHRLNELFKIFLNNQVISNNIEASKVTVNFVLEFIKPLVKDPEHIQSLINGFYIDIQDKRKAFELYAALLEEFVYKYNIDDWTPEYEKQFFNEVYSQLSEEDWANTTPWMGKYASNGVEELGTEYPTIMGCLSHFIAEHIISNNYDQWKDFATRYDNIFRDMNSLAFLNDTNDGSEIGLELSKSIAQVGITSTDFATLFSDFTHQHYINKFAKEYDPKLRKDKDQQEPDEREGGVIFLGSSRNFRPRNNSSVQIIGRPAEHNLSIIPEIYTIIASTLTPLTDSSQRIIVSS